MNQPLSFYLMPPLLEPRQAREGLLRQLLVSILSSAIFIETKCQDVCRIRFVAIPIHFL